MAAKISCDVALEKAGSVRILFEGAADPAKLAGLQLHPARQPASETSPVKRYDRADIVADGKAELTVPDVVPGRYLLQSYGDWQIPYVAQASPEYTVPPGGVAEVVVKVSPAAEVRGRLIDGKSGAGIAGATIGVAAPRKEGGGRQMFAIIKTDSEGRYHAFVSPGDPSVAMVRGQMPPGYLPLPDDQPTSSAVVTAGKSHTFPDMVLEPAVPVDGIVVDAAGAPMPGVTVYAANDIDRMRLPEITDAAGRFRLTDLGADDLTALRARTPSATTGGAISVSTRNLRGPVKLVVSPENACRIRGRVVDPDGKPIAGAAVSVEWRYWGVGRSAKWGSSGEGGIVETAADGTFETPVLWPGDNYCVRVGAAQFGKVEAPIVHGVAGQFHELGTITLPRIAGVVAGIVVDATDKPVAGVRVFNQGDGPKPVSVTTGPDGRFRLTGLYAGPVFVMAQMDGHRFTAAQTASGNENLRVTLLPAGTSPPDQPDRRPAAYLAARAKLARHLLDRLWNLPQKTLGGSDRRVLEGMARLDPVEARRWLEERRQRGEPGAGESSALANVLRIADARRVAGTDADEAIRLLSRNNADEAFRQLIDLSREFALADPPRATRFAEEAVVRARGMKLPARVWSLATAGELVMELNRDAGRKLIVEAAELAEPLGNEAMQGYARGFVAARLASFDLERAKSLLPTEPIGEANRWRVAVARRVAATDLNAALKLLDGVRPDNSFILSLARQRIAVRAATAGRAAEAVEVAEAIAEPQYRTAALAGIAVAVARSDASLSRSLIDRAAAYLSEHPETFSSWSSMYGGASGIAAWLAYQARLAGHPDVASIEGRALACRLTLRMDSPEQVAEMQAKAAMILSLTDPATAKFVLDRAAPPGQPAPGNLRLRREWLFAVALTDPKRAISEVDHQIDEVANSRENLQGTNLIELLITLTQPNEADTVRELTMWVGLPGGRDDD
jgi:hypothetical protein